MEMIKSRGLVYEYHTHNDMGEIEELNRAIDHVDIDIDRGEFIAILGHNGSGKSTMAKHLNALLTPSEGTLWVKGMDTKEEDNIWDIRQTAGMVFQNPDNQIIATVVEEDVAFGPENLGIEANEIRKRVDKALDTVGMNAYSTHSPNKLSGGQKQRIAIAGVLAMKPECIILDEPTAMLDPSGRREVINTVRELNKNDNITIILITHYMEEAIEADKVFVMDEGKISLHGTPNEVFTQVEQMKELGLDVPQVTELAYKLRKNNINIPANILNVKEMVDALCQLK
ncbi:energy-coupling factor transporter ATP-binding protein EcfA [Vallitalea longa]|uniref:Energy-coupling factor transporter ATP-binding protein EcfA n=1 Tax=Vallitalea longa TaxID=2936439 RepID=A0A9W6DDM3_9FIRM|nr:energy-coupling factor transporter ATPase [Vallitalea longa]GKX28425.1 energy-coupling factor transporter ATP-binding protein EcfA [Vallitalea longa]